MKMQMFPFEDLISIASTILLFFAIKSGIKNMKERKEKEKKLTVLFLRKKETIGGNWRLLIQNYFTQKDIELLFDLGEINQDDYQKIITVGFISDENVEKENHFEPIKYTGKAKKSLGKRRQINEKYF